MKNLLVAFWIGIASIPAFAQMPDTLPWCPPGATWVYKVATQTANVFNRYTYIGDTTIQGKIAKKLDVGYVIYQGAVPDYRGEIPNVGTEYLYNSNDSVFFWDNGAFNFMYDFNAQLNDTFQISNSREICPFDSTYPTFAKVVVTDVWKDTLNGVIYDKFWTSYDQPFEVGGAIRNIGSMLCPFPQISSGICRDTTFIDGGIHRFQELSCYFDSLRGEISFDNSYSGADCYGIRTSNEALVDPEPQVRIYPNPVKNELQVEGLTGVETSYQIYDLNGRRVSEGKLADQLVSVNGLPSGMYLIRFSMPTRKAATFKFVKGE